MTRVSLSTLRLCNPTSSASTRVWTHPPATRPIECLLFDCHYLLYSKTQQQQKKKMKWMQYYLLLPLLLPLPVNWCQYFLDFIFSLIFFLLGFDGFESFDFRFETGWEVNSSDNRWQLQVTVLFESFIWVSIDDVRGGPSWPTNSSWTIPAEMKMNSKILKPEKEEEEEEEEEKNWQLDSVRHSSLSFFLNHSLSISILHLLHLFLPCPCFSSIYPFLSLSPSFTRPLKKIIPICHWSVGNSGVMVTWLLTTDCDRRPTPSL